MCGCGFEGWMRVLCGCGFEDWLSDLCGCVGHAIFESLFHVLCGGGGISLRNSMERRSEWVFRGLKSCFEVKNFSIFPFFAIFAFILFC